MRYEITYEQRVRGAGDRWVQREVHSYAKTPAEDDVALGSGPFNIVSVGGHGEEHDHHH